MKTILIFALALVLGGCASRKYGDDNVETKIDAKGHAPVGVIGFDSNDLVIQNTTSVSSELTIQMHVNEKLQEGLNHEAFMLSWCRQDLADVRIGGSGEVVAISQLDNLKSDPEIKEKFGTDESGQLVFVKKQSLKKTIESERQYENSLRSLAAIIKNHRSECEQKMATQRVKHGLPSKRLEAETRFENGNIVIVRPAERSLDDAFKFSSAENK